VHGVPSSILARVSPATSPAFPPALSLKTCSVTCSVLELHSPPHDGEKRSSRDCCRSGRNKGPDFRAVPYAILYSPHDAREGFRTSSHNGDISLPGRACIVLQGRASAVPRLNGKWKYHAVTYLDP
jgi:hypothetical protein